MKTMTNLSEIKRQVRTLTLKELAKLVASIQTLMDIKESAMRERRGSGRHEVLETRRAAHKTYRLELVRCGKKTCKCKQGKFHGPYWYAYWTENGKAKSQYIGKKFQKKHPM